LCSFFIAPTATELYALPLHDALPILEKYRQASRHIHAIFQRYTSLIEPLSLDEAYLDVTHATACRGSATLIAREIRDQVREELRSEEHTSELQSRENLVCRLLLEKKK